MTSKSVKRTPSAAATVQVPHALPAVRSLVLTAGLRGQFPRWREINFLLTFETAPFICKHTV